MVISIEIPKSSQVKLIEEASRQGKSIEIYAAELLQKAVESNRSFSEIGSLSQRSCRLRNERRVARHNLPIGSQFGAISQRLSGYATIQIC